MLQHFFLFLYDLYSDPMQQAWSIQDTSIIGHASLKNSPTFFHKYYLLFPWIQQMHCKFWCISDIHTAPSHLIQAPVLLSTPKVSKQSHKTPLFACSQLFHFQQIYVQLGLWEMKWYGDSVCIRLEGTFCDLHAADARSV